MSYNKMYNIWIKNENTVPTDRGNMSIYSQANSYLNQITSDNIAIGKTNTNYKLDISGNVNIEYGSITLNGDTTTNKLTVQDDLIVYNTSLSGLLYNKPSYNYVNDSIYNLQYNTISSQLNSKASYNYVNDSIYNLQYNTISSQLNSKASNTYVNDQVYNLQYNTISSQLNQLNIRKSDITFVNDRFFNLTLSGIVVSTRTQFNRGLFVGGKSSSQPSPFVLDVSGSCNFNLNASPNLVQNNGIFLMGPLAGFTTPTYNNFTIIINQTSGNTTTTWENWTWGINGKGILYWIYLGTTSNNLYGGSPLSSYYMFNQSYKGSAYYMEYDLGFMQSGPVVLSFLSYWGGDNFNFNTNSYISVSLTGATDIFNYNDNQTRRTLSWVSRSYYFEKLTSGATKIRFTFNDNLSATDALTFWTITGVNIRTYTNIRLLDQVGGKVAYIGPTLTKLNGCQLYDVQVYNNLKMNGIPQFNNVNGTNTDVLCLNNSSANVAGSANNNCILVGPNTFPYMKTGVNLIGIGSYIEANNSSNRNDMANNIAIGNNILPSIQNSIVIGNNNRCYYDISSWTVGASNYEVKGPSNSIVIGHGVGASISNPSVLDSVGIGRFSVSIGSNTTVADAYYGYNNHFSAFYNGFNRSYGPEPVAAYNIAIGAGVLRSTIDNYNTGVGCYALNRMGGNPNTDNPSINRCRFNSAYGFNAGNKCSENINFNLFSIENCSYFGANATSTYNGIKGATALGCNSRANFSYSTAIGCDTSNNIANSIRLGGDNIDVYTGKDIYIRGNIYNTQFNNLVNQINNLSISGNSNFSSLSQQLSNLTISDYTNRLISDNNYSILNTQLSYQTLSGYTNRLLIDSNYNYFNTQLSYLTISDYTNRLISDNNYSILNTQISYQTLSGFTTRLFVDETSNLLKTQIAYQTLSGFTTRLLVDSNYNYFNTQLSYLTISDYTNRLVFDNNFSILNTRLSYLTISDYTNRLLVDSNYNYFNTQLSYLTISDYTNRLVFDNNFSILNTRLSYQTLSGFTTRLFVDEVSNILKTQISYQTLSGYANRLISDNNYSILNTRLSYQTLSGFTTRLFVDETSNILRTQISYQTLSGYVNRLISDNNYSILNTRLSYQTLSGYSNRLLIDSKAPIDNPTFSNGINLYSYYKPYSQLTHTSSSTLTMTTPFYGVYAIGGSVNIINFPTFGANPSTLIGGLQMKFVKISSPASTNTVLQLQAAQSGGACNFVDYTGGTFNSFLASITTTLKYFTITLIVTQSGGQPNYNYYFNVY